MSSEVSIAKQLSGRECLEACIESLRTRLAKDDRFASHMSYTGFLAMIDFKFYPQMSFIPGIEAKVLVQEGEQTEIAEVATVDESITLPMRPPNQVREEAGMPTPVMVTDGKGRSTEKWVKMGSIPAKGAPKNNVKVGGR